MTAKRNRWPMPKSPVFAVRDDRVKWPTIRGARLDDAKVAALRKFAYGVIFLDGPYNTRLNFKSGVSIERAVFFEHLHRVDGDSLFLLCWLGNFEGGAIFHCAWQFPQHLHWPVRALERAAFQTYRRVCSVMYRGVPPGDIDDEVQEFLKIGRYSTLPVDREEEEEGEGEATDG